MSDQHPDALQDVLHLSPKTISAHTLKDSSAPQDANGCGGDTCLGLPLHSLTQQYYITTDAETDRLSVVLAPAEGNSSATFTRDRLNYPWGIRMEEYAVIGNMPAKKCPSGQLAKAISDARTITPGKKNYAGWERMQRAVAGRNSFFSKLQEAERQVNRYIEYTSDQKLYGMKDYLALPSQIIARAKGDCEDDAILKYALLADAGIPVKDMAILVVRDYPISQHHAILLVRQETTDGQGNSLTHDYILNSQKSPEHYDKILASQSKPYPILAGVTDKICQVYGKIISQKR